MAGVSAAEWTRGAALALLALGCARTSQVGAAPPSEPSPDNRVFSGRVVQLELGGPGGCVLDDRGAAACWVDAERAMRAVQWLPAVVELSVAGSQGCGRTTRGEVWCWPLAAGQVGPHRGRAGPPVFRAPVANATTLTSGSRSVCATHPGGATCWDSDALPFRGRVELPHATAVAFDREGLWFVADRRGVSVRFRGKQALIQPLADVTEVRTLDHSIYLRNARGAILRLGPGDEVPVAVATGQLAVGSDHACALSPSHELSCWGANDVGQISPRATAAGFGVPIALGVEAPGSRVQIHGRLTCIADPRSVRRCWGECSGLPSAAKIPCEARSVPAASRGTPCALDAFDPKGSCIPGDEISLLSASCNELGRWQIIRRPRHSDGPGNGIAFGRGSAALQPSARHLDAADLARVPGKIYILGHFYGDEHIPGLGRARAEAVRTAYVHEGVCPEKVVVVDGGLIPHSPVERIGAVVVYGPGSAEALRWSGITGPDAEVGPDR